MEGRSRPQALGIEWLGKREEAIRASISSRQSAERGRGVEEGVGWHVRAVVSGRGRRRRRMRWTMVVWDGMVWWGILSIGGLRLCDVGVGVVFILLGGDSVGG